MSEIKVKKPYVVAHRGASGYLPEHTLEAKAYAHALGADYIEQDVVATRDHRLIVLHDVYLDHTTDVAAVFPDRKRADGRFYAADFDLQEIRQLAVTERVDDQGQAVFPDRYPVKAGHFKVPELSEEIEMIHGMNVATGRAVGIYPEIKRPQWHRREGIDLSVLVIELLEAAGYNKRQDDCFLQCFDAAEVRRIRDDLGCDLKLVQLIADNSWGESSTDYDRLLTESGLAELRELVDGIGPWLSQLVTQSADRTSLRSTGVAELARKLNLEVHPYTFRKEQLIPAFDSLEAMIHWFVTELGISGFFTDFPDSGVRALQTLR